MNKYLRIPLLIIAILLVGCEDMLNPVDENHRSLDDIYDNPMFAEGVLMNAYTRIPTNSYSFNDVATDDAVTNDKQSNYLRMATGQWSSVFNPVDQWNNSFTAIMYINLILSKVDDIEWSYTSADANTLFIYRHKGEAHGLRALFMLYLLQSHGGYSGGELLGVPIIDKTIEDDMDFSAPRNTFEECIQQIYSDLDKAEMYLPTDYGDVFSRAALPSEYRDYSVEQYNRVFGNVSRQRLSGRAVIAIRAKAALLAASPAYTNGTSTIWEDAANYSASVLDLIGGVSGLDQGGVTFYSGLRDQPEIIWRTSQEGGTGSLDLERDNFPPSLYGNGRVNPTQNLVNAFPMENGFPIDHPNSNYNPQDPYSGRDPRLRKYILVNGESFADQVIQTAVGSGDDAVDQLITSTRTGYYLRKLLLEDVNVNPASEQPRRHFFPHIRYTEIFLIYAEAANEAWGPDGSGPNGYSARDVVSAIRTRAGISQPDSYLASISSKEDMRELIRNERRLELCFEGFRFWDLRRWEDDITEPARGVRINGNSYEVSVVENRVYNDYMIYPPIPDSEVLKFGLNQNNGW